MRVVGLEDLVDALELDDDDELCDHGRTLDQDCVECDRRLAQVIAAARRLLASRLH